MQTFLPYPDFAESAAALDSKRLGKQRVEALQVLRALTRPTYGWKRHPAVRMWAGCAEGVGAYGVAVCLEWISRGGADTVAGTSTKWVPTIALTAMTSRPMNIIIRSIMCGPFMGHMPPPLEASRNQGGRSTS